MTRLTHQYHIHYVQTNWSLFLFASPRMCTYRYVLHRCWTLWMARISALKLETAEINWKYFVHLLTTVFMCTCVVISLLNQIEKLCCAKRQCIVIDTTNIVHLVVHKKLNREKDQRHPSVLHDMTNSISIFWQAIVVQIRSLCWIASSCGVAVARLACKTEGAVSNLVRGQFITKYFLLIANETYIAC